MKRLCKIIAFLSVVFVLSSCSDSVENSADELTLNSWYAELSNKTTMSLDFSLDFATLKIQREGEESVEISGLCEVSESAFVIHDKLTNTPYAFEYDVNFDRIEVVYGSNTVSFDKK